jgi:hypothetical protein
LYQFLLPTAADLNHLPLLSLKEGVINIYSVAIFSNTLSLPQSIPSFPNPWRFSGRRSLRSLVVKAGDNRSIVYPST